MKKLVLVIGIIVAALSATTTLRAQDRVTAKEELTVSIDSIDKDKNKNKNKDKNKNKNKNKEKNKQKNKEKS